VRNINYCHFLISCEFYCTHYLTYCFDRSLIKLMPMGDFFEEQFKFADVFNLLRLNDAEIGLFTGVLIVNPGTGPFE
jgi:hypothetical protein